MKPLLHSFYLMLKLFGSAFRTNIDNGAIYNFQPLSPSTFKLLVKRSKDGQSNTTLFMMREPHPNKHKNCAFAKNLF